MNGIEIERSLPGVKRNTYIYTVIGCIVFRSETKLCVVDLTDEKKPLELPIAAQMNNTNRFELQQQ